MGSRSDWLTDFAKPVADDLAARSGSLKHVLSAGVMALAGCMAELREYYMARATGAEIDAMVEDERIARVLIRILRDGTDHLSPEDREFLQGVRRLLAADTEGSASPAVDGRPAETHKRPKAS